MRREDHLDFFKETIEKIKILLGDKNCQGAKLLMAGELGTNGLAFDVYEDHILYFGRLNATLKENQVFDSSLISRWAVANDLIIFHLSTVTDNQSHFMSIKRDALNLSAISTFPVIEEVARKISGYWDDEGFMIKDLPTDLKLMRIDSKGKKVEKEYKVEKKNRIVDLSHKLILLEYSLNDSLKKLFKNLDQRMQKPLIDGIDGEMSTMYERIEFHRNMFFHGRKFDGIIGIFISLLLALIYFGGDEENR